MANYKKFAEDAAAYLGGQENIHVANHCATRLRVTVEDPSIVDTEKLENLSEVVGVVKREKEFQMIIGTHVGNVYNDFIKYANIQESGKVHENLDDSRDLPPANKKSIKSILSSIVDFISGTFVPVLPILVAAGLVSAVLNIAVTFFGLAGDSGTYAILDAINQAGFYFLPVFLGYSAARKLGINAMMGAFLGAILVFPGINDTEGLSFLGIAIPQIVYSTSVIPVILGVLFMYYVDRGVNKIIPKEISFFAAPLIIILIVTPVTLFLLGPLGTILGGYIASALNFINTELGWLSVGLIGALTPLLVMTGTNQALFPLVFASIAENGYDAFVLPGMLAANVAVGAAALSVYFQVKDKDTKALSLSSGITGVMGITEPSIFGVLLRFKRPLIGAIIGGGAGGLLAGIVQLQQYAVVSPGIAAIPTFIPIDGSGLSSNFWFALLVILLAGTVAFVATSVIGIEKKDKEKAISGKAEHRSMEQVFAPLDGEVLSLEDVPDPMFADKMMGEGFAIIPTSETLVSPIKGTVIQIFPTKHAVGLRSVEGLEILIHVGLNTVDLQGDGFEQLVEVDQQVEPGEPLLHVDLNLLQSKNINPVTPIVVTNAQTALERVELIPPDNKITREHIANFYIKNSDSTI